MNLRTQHLVPMYLDHIYRLLYAQWLLSISTLHTITQAGKNQKHSFLHGDETPWKECTITTNTKKLPPPLTENNVENFIYVSSIEQNNK